MSKRIEEYLSYRFTKEEWESEIQDFLYGIELDGREMSEEEIDELRDMNYVKSISPSIYSE